MAEIKRKCSGGGRRPLARLSVAGLLAATSIIGFTSTVAGLTATATLVKNIEAGVGSSDPTPLAVVGGRALVLAYSSATGYELHVSDGTARGTTLLKDITPGIADTYVAEITVVSGVGYFGAFDGVAGRELWKTDGTPAGTVLVKDIDPFDGSIGSIVQLGSKVVFEAWVGQDQQLWSTDGTAAGTALVKDLNGGVNDIISRIVPISPTQAVFSGSSGSQSNVELWATDGTTDGTTLVKDINPGPTGGMGSVTPVAIGGKAVFAADSGTTGLELWITDGTTDGTAMVKDIEAGPLGSGPVAMATLGSKWILRAWTSSTGFEPWVTDGTADGTFALGDLHPGVESSLNGGSRHFATVGSRTLFAAFSPDAGSELWSTDGSVAGTSLLVDPNPGSASSSPEELFAFGDAVFFSAFTPGSGREVWASDGTAAGTSSAAAINPPSGSNPFRFAAFGTALLFAAYRDDVGTELFRLDASPTFSCTAAPNRRWQTVVTAAWNLPATSTTSITSVQIARPDGLAVATKAGRSTSGSFSTTLKTVTDATGYSCRFYSGVARGDATTLERTITIGAAALRIAAPSQALPESSTPARPRGGFRR